MAGDFNTSCNQSDRASGKLDKSSDTDVIDTFKFINPETKGFTYIHTSGPSRQISAVTMHVDIVRFDDLKRRIDLEDLCHRLLCQKLKI